MPPQTLFDISSVDLTKVVVTREEIYRLIPQRYEFALLDGLCHLDLEAKEMIAFVDLKPDAYWVRGHIPGRPLFPGVLMIETAAQLINYFTKAWSQHEGFMAFSGVDGVKFRGQVVPGDRLYMLGKMTDMRGRRRCMGQTQGFVGDRMVFEGTIAGTML